MTMSAPWTRVNFCGANQPKGPGERSRTMIMIGADYHPAFQQIAFVDTETGELQERRLDHPEEAEKFYRELAVQGNESTRGDGSQRASALVRATAYEQLKKFGSHAGQPGNRDGVK